MKKAKIIRIVALVLGIVILIGAIFLIVGISVPPKYEDIEADFKALMLGSQKINTVLFGVGLPTYERITDPKASTKVHSTGEYYTTSSGNEVEIKIYYYKTYDAKNTVFSYRPSYPFGTKSAYVYVADKGMSAAELAALFPAVQNAYLPEGKTFYSEIYRSADGKKIGYLIPYEEQFPDFTYTAVDDEKYDYVKSDAEFKSIDEIKAEAEKYYNKEYLESLYPAYFDGVASAGIIQNPKFKQLDRGLAQLNSFEPMFKDHRVFLFDTAKVIAWGSSPTFVRIEIQSYSPNNPSKITTDEIQLVKQGSGDTARWVLNTLAC